MDLGEQVDYNKETVKKLDSTWTVTVVVYYTGSHYNIYGEIRENTRLLRSADEYSYTESAREKDNVHQTAENLIEDLFENAAERRNARNLSLNISIE